MCPPYLWYLISRTDKMPKINRTRRCLATTIYLLRQSPWVALVNFRPEAREVCTNEETAAARSRPAAAKTGRTATNSNVENLRKAPRSGIDRNSRAARTRRDHSEGALRTRWDQCVVPVAFAF